MREINREINRDINKETIKDNNTVEKVDKQTNKELRINTFIHGGYYLPK